MAITPSSRWISKNESDEDSVPFERSKKAEFQTLSSLAETVYHF